MFASRYFNPRYWASRYWPKVGGVPTDTADSTFGVIGLIDQTGQGNTGRILTRPLAVSGMIYDTFGVSGTIDETGQGNIGRIDTRPTTVKGNI